jgi:hypothetical protein
MREVIATIFGTGLAGTIGILALDRAALRWRAVSMALRLVAAGVLIGVIALDLGAALGSPRVLVVPAIWASVSFIVPAILLIRRPITGPNPGAAHPR